MAPRVVLLAAIVGVLLFIEPSTVEVPDPGMEARHSRLGIHSIRPDGVEGFVQDAVNGGTYFSVVKAVDDLGHLASVKQTSLGTVIVARMTSEHEGAGMINDPATNLEWYAGVIMDVIFDKLDATPGLADIVDYWEPVNEPLGGGTHTSAYERLAQLMIYSMDLAEEAGVRLALFSFSAGTPEWADMTAIVETGVFARAKAGGHILALHEGVFGADDPVDLWYGYPIPGAPEIPNAGPLCGRYRFWYHLLQQRDEIVPLFVSEFYAGGGYGTDASIADIVQRMAWYDSQLRQNTYALGFAPFTLGPVGQWKTQDYEFVYPALVEYMINLVDEGDIFVFLPLVSSTHNGGTS